MSTPALVDPLTRTVRLDHLFTPAEVARYLRCTTDTVREKVRSGEMHALGGGRGNRRILIPALALAEYLNNY